jgi:hypothetical protein
MLYQVGEEAAMVFPILALIQLYIQVAPFLSQVHIPMALDPYQV